MLHKYGIKIILVGLLLLCSIRIYASSQKVDVTLYYYLNNDYILLNALNPKTEKPAGLLLHCEDESKNHADIKNKPMDSSDNFPVMLFWTTMGLSTDSLQQFSELQEQVEIKSDGRFGWKSWLKFFDYIKNNDMISTSILNVNLERVTDADLNKNQKNQLAAVFDNKNSNNNYTSTLLCDFNKKIEFKLSRKKLDFDSVAVNGTKTIDFILENTGQGEVEIKNMTFDKNIKSFKISKSSFSIGEGEGEKKKIEITFTPTKNKRYDCNFIITSNAEGVIKIPVVGKGYSAVPTKSSLNDFIKQYLGYAVAVLCSFIFFFLGRYFKVKIVRKNQKEKEISGLSNINSMSEDVKNYNEVLVLLEIEKNSNNNVIEQIKEKWNGNTKRQNKFRKEICLSLQIEPNSSQKNIISKLKKKIISSDRKNDNLNDKISNLLNERSGLKENDIITKLETILKDREKTTNQYCNLKRSISSLIDINNNDDDKKLFKELKDKLFALNKEKENYQELKIDVCKKLNVNLSPESNDEILKKLQDKLAQLNNSIRLHSDFKERLLTLFKLQNDNGENYLFSELTNVKKEFDDNKVIVSDLEEILSIYLTSNEISDNLNRNYNLFVKKLQKDDISTPEYIKDIVLAFRIAQTNLSVTISFLKEDSNSLPMVNFFFNYLQKLNDKVNILLGILGSASDREKLLAMFNLSKQVDLFDLNKDIFVERFVLENSWEFLSGILRCGIFLKAFVNETRMPKEAVKSYSKILGTVNQLLKKLDLHPHSIELFTGVKSKNVFDASEFRDDVHERNGVSTLLKDPNFKKIINGKVEDEILANGHIFDVQSVGFTSKVTGIPSQKSMVSVYYDANRDILFG